MIRNVIISDVVAIAENGGLVRENVLYQGNLGW